MDEERILCDVAMRTVNQKFPYLKENEKFSKWLNIFVTIFLDEVGDDVEWFEETIAEQIEDAMDKGAFSTIDNDDEEDLEEIIAAEERRQKFFF